MEKLLIVDDDDVIRRSVARWVHRRSRYEAIECSTLAEGRAALDCVPSAVIVDVGLPDGNGLDLIPELRARSAIARVLVLTASTSGGVVNRAYLLDAALARKPCGDSVLRRFLDVTDVQRQIHDRRNSVTMTLEAAIDEVSSRVGLTSQQRRIVVLRAMGVKRSELADTLQLSEATIRAHIRAIVGRARIERLDQLAWLLLNAVTDRSYDGSL